MASKGGLTATRGSFACIPVWLIKWLSAGLEGTYGKVGTSGGKKLDMSKITMGKKDKKKKKR